MTPLTPTRSFLNDHFDGDLPDRLLVGVSGGPDSMVLLDVLRRLQSEFDYRLLPLHFNYRFHERAREAFDLLKQYCERHQLALVAASLLDPERHRGATGGLEARARELRFDFFEAHARGFGADGVVLAHHRNDQVETVLLNLGRGCGPGALAGMSAVMNRGELRVLRPLLTVDQADVLQYARERDLEYIEDPTNEDEGYARNRLRHTVLPEWEQVQPAPIDAIANLASRVDRENDFWENHLRREVRDWRWPREVQVDRTVFEQLHPAVQFRYLRGLVESLTGSLRGWSEDNLDDVRGLFESGRSGARLSLPGSVHAINEYDRGCLFTSDLEREEQFAPEGTVPASWNWLDVGTLKITTGAGESSGIEEELSLSLDRDQFSNLVVRTWSDGDVAFGPEGDSRLKELFEENSVPWRARRYWPVLEVDGTVVGLPGLTGSPDHDESVRVVFRPDHPAFSQLELG